MGNRVCCNKSLSIIEPTPLQTHKQLSAIHSPRQQQRVSTTPAEQPVLISGKKIFSIQQSYKVALRHPVHPMKKKMYFSKPKVTKTIKNTEQGEGDEYINGYRVLQIIGEGMFGDVKKVERKIESVNPGNRETQYFALKTFSKMMMTKQKNYLKNEQGGTNGTLDYLLFQIKF